MTLTEFCEKMLIALYQDGHQSNEWLSFADLQKRYGFSGDPSWLSRAMNHLSAQRRVEGRELNGAPDTVVGRITGSGMAYIEAKYGSKDGVGTILQPINEVHTDESLYDPTGDVLFTSADGTISAIEIPASDRVVSLSHNEVIEAEQPVSELIGSLEADNGNPNQIGMRERLLGEMKAGRELIRAGSYRAYLLYETLVRALGELVKRYGNPTLAALANALLGALAGQLIQAK